MLGTTREAFIIGDEAVHPGTQRTVDLSVSMLSNHMPIHLPVRVVHGIDPGPVLFLSGAVHGNEITGVEIIRRVLRDEALATLSGTLLAVPIVNALGFLSQSRYLPDGRDLNRCFPGSDRGSLASILADLFLREVVSDRSLVSTSIQRAPIASTSHRSALHRTSPSSWNSPRPLAHQSS